VGGWPFRLRECTFSTWQNGPPSMVSKVPVYLQGEAVLKVRQAALRDVFVSTDIVSSVDCCLAASLLNATRDNVF
jgi:hypothetical protein